MLLVLKSQWGNRKTVTLPGTKTRQQTQSQVWPGLERPTGHAL